MKKIKIGKNQSTFNVAPSRYSNATVAETQRYELATYATTTVDSCLVPWPHAGIYARDRVRAEKSTTQTETTFFYCKNSTTVGVNS